MDARGASWAAAFGTGPVQGVKQAVKQTAAVVLMAAGLAGCSSIGNLWDSTWDNVGAAFEDDGVASSSLRRDTDTVPDVDTVPEERLSRGKGGLPEGLVGDGGRAPYDDTIHRTAPAELRPLEEPPLAPISPEDPEAVTGALEQTWQHMNAATVPDADVSEEAVEEAAEEAPSISERFRALTDAVSDDGGAEDAVKADTPSDTPAYEGISSTAPEEAAVPSGTAPLPEGSGGAGQTLIIGGEGTRVASEAEIATLGLGTGSYDPQAFRISSHVATITFPKGSANLSGRDLEILDSVVKIHQETGGKLRVIGHASSRTADMDEVRHKMVNFKVSSQRANAVANALLKKGIAPDDLFAGAVSDSEPLYYEVMPSGEIGNQRAEIFIDY